jgi:lysophospholipid acyltransferase (LPLAT)-like uncharacterized protein/ribosomal protein S27AE
MKWYQKACWKFLQLTYGNFCKWFYEMEYFEEDQEPDEPYLLLANHAYHSDAFILATGLNKPLRYLASDEDASLVQQILAELVGLIYTRKGTVDTKAVRKLFSSVKRGDSIAIYPEGDGTWDGATDRIHENIVKLARRFAIPIRLARITGGYMVRPKWAVSGRRGKVTITFKTLSRQTINNISDRQLMTEITGFIKHDDVPYNLNHGNRYSGSRCAEGIENILWKCPLCGETDSITGHRSRITCSSCSYGWHINANMEITPATKGISTTREWCKWQYREIESMVEESKYLLTRTDSVECLEVTDHGTGLHKHSVITRSLGHGQLTLTAEDLYFQVPGSSSITLFLVDRISGFVDTLNRFCRFNYQGKEYMIRFKGKNASRYQYLIRILGDHSQSRLNRAM